MQAAALDPHQLDSSSANSLASPATATPGTSLNSSPQMMSEALHPHPALLGPNQSIQFHQGPIGHAHQLDSSPANSLASPATATPGAPLNSSPQMRVDALHQHPTLLGPNQSIQFQHRPHGHAPPTLSHHHPQAHSHQHPLHGHPMHQHQAASLHLQHHPTAQVHPSQQQQQLAGLNQSSSAKLELPIGVNSIQAAALAKQEQTSNAQLTPAGSKKQRNSPLLAEVAKINSPNLLAEAAKINSPNSVNIGTVASNSNTTNNSSNNGSNNNNNSGASNGNSSGRSKRLRTSFKHNQLKEMKKWFSKNQNPDAKELKTLAQTTGLSKRVLQVSFDTRAVVAPPSVHLYLILT